MVSHYLAGGRETTRGASTQPVLLRGHKACGFHSSWGNRVKAVGGNGRRGGGWIEGGLVREVRLVRKRDGAEKKAGGRRQGSEGNTGKK